MKKLEISVIGAGKIIENYHLPLLRNIPELNVKKIYDINQSHNEKIAKKCKGHWWNVTVLA